MSDTQQSNNKNYYFSGLRIERTKFDQVILDKTCPVNIPDNVYVKKVRNGFAPSRFDNTNEGYCGTCSRGGRGGMSEYRGY